VLMDQSSRDDTLAGIGSPRLPSGDAVSSKSSKDERCERSPEVASMGEGSPISAAPGAPVAPHGEAPMLAPREGGRLPAGWRVIAAKEMADHLLSVRFLVLLLVLGLAGVLILYTVAGAIREVAEAATTARAVFLALFTIEPATDFTAARLPSFVALVGFLGPLLGIAFGFDSISSERSESTLPRLVAQPIHRDDVINGKFVAGLAVIAVILAAVTLLVAAVGMLRLGIVPTADDAARLATWYVMSVFYIGFWLALATLCSVTFRRAATGALVVLAAWLVLTFFGGLIVDVIAGWFARAGELGWYTWRQDIGRLLPQTLYAEMTTAVLDPSVRTLDVIGGAMLGFERRAIPTLLPYVQSVLIVWPQMVGLVAATVVCFALAYVGFMRQEVRA
jgi:ABC-2 type transport system permease protein